MTLASCRIGPDSKQYQCWQHIPFSIYDKSHDSKPAMFVFRRALCLKRMPEQILAFHTGACKYRIFINGRYIDDGPVEIGGDYGKKDAPNWWYYDRRDLTSFFKAGKNVIVAEVLSHPEAATDYSFGELFLALQLFANDSLLLETDASWKAIRNEGYISPTEFDEAKSPGEYHKEDFDDTAWPLAEPLSTKGIIPEHMDFLPHLEEHCIFPDDCFLPFPECEAWILDLKALSSCSRAVTTVLPGPPVRFGIRFQNEVFGHLELETETSSMATITVEFYEVPGQISGIFKYSCAQGRHSHRFSLPLPMQIGLVTIDCGPCFGHAAKPLKLHSLKMNSRCFPLPEAASFHCSLPTFENVRAMVDRTMRLCMMRLHLDSPVHQEGLGCPGDYMIEALISYSLYGESRLVRADLSRIAKLLLQQKGCLHNTSYALLWTEMVKDYYMYTGDLALVRDIFPAIQAVLGRFSSFLGKSGLLTKCPDYSFIDWFSEGGINYAKPPAERGMACMTAFYYRALRNSAFLCDELGMVHDYAAQADDIKQAFNEKLYDSANSCYCDGISFIAENRNPLRCPDDTGKSGHSIHANVLAVSYGLADKERIPVIIDRIMAEISCKPPSPYFMHFVFEALETAGLWGKYGFALLGRWEKLLKEHPASLRECWDCGDYSHAWSGTPAYQISRSILGISPLRPGYSMVRFAPSFGNLEYVEGDVPTIHGIIHVCHCNGTTSIKAPATIKVQCEKL